MTQRTLLRGVAATAAGIGSPFSSISSGLPCWRTRMQPEAPLGTTENVSAGVTGGGKSASATSADMGISTSYLWERFLRLGLILTAAMMGCRSESSIGPGFAPDPELMDDVVEALAAWDEHYAGLYIDPNGTPVVVSPDCLHSDNNPCAYAVTDWPHERIVVWLDGTPEDAMQTLLRHELCHVLKGEGRGHPDAPGVCGTQMWESGGVISPEDLDWVGL